MNDLLHQEETDIMLAEDDNDDVSIFKMALDELGFSYELRHAENGEVLFMLLRKKVPYVLFLDIMMPCKNGIACISEIRKHREYDSLPIIMYTSFFTDKSVNESYRAGANYFLTKTSNFKELVAKLKKVFSIDWKAFLHYPPSNQFVLS